MKTSKLEGALLDYWVARADNLPVRTMLHADGTIGSVETNHLPSGNFRFSPSTSWAQGGPIIERERGTFTTYFGLDGEVLRHSSDMGIDMQRYREFGPTYLVAAMRAYVGSKFGDEVADVEGSTVQQKPAQKCPACCGGALMGDGMCPACGGTGKKGGA